MMKQKMIHTLVKKMCEHKFIHMETVKKQSRSGPYQTHWLKIDRLFCEKCGETKQVRTEEYDRDKPEWY